MHSLTSSGNKFSSNHACVMVIGVWCYASVFALGPLVHWGSFGPEPYGTACCINWYENKHFIINMRNYRKLILQWCLFHVVCSKVHSIPWCPCHVLHHQSFYLLLRFPLYNHHPILHLHPAHSEWVSPSRSTACLTTNQSDQRTHSYRQGKEGLWDLMGLFIVGFYC